MYIDVRDSLYVYICAHINRESQRHEDKEHMKSWELILVIRCRFALTVISLIYRHMVPRNIWSLENYRKISRFMCERKPL